ncbi:unnamed protein product [Cylicostephanus goldi]|uniref:Aminopeptidase N-like N-terminal domain-containing protein n=1 Tax=Cylicostephanus goldi TaxID=71465 RepID=A0A3P6S3N0_CYLGO|nr:unnamed protein product [Cylicostephanus goldi]
MEFTVRLVTKRVQVHVKNLNVTVIRLYMGTKEIPIHEVGRAERVPKYNANELKISNNFPQLLDIYSSCDLLPNRNYTLALEYQTNINNPKYAGIFTAPYKHGSENRFKTATHLQPQEARSLFPCIDSPEAKAMFQAVIVHPVGTYALFNMKEANITTEG